MRFEQATRLVLFDRNTRGFQPTENARALFPLAQRMEADADALAAIAHDLSRPRPIRITAPEHFGDRTMGIFSEFAAAYPDIAIKFVHSMQVLDLLAGDADIAFRVSNGDHDPELIQRKLGADRFTLYGSQDYADRYGLPSVMLERIACGPKLPSVRGNRCRAAARQNRRSLRTQNRADNQLVVCGLCCHWIKQFERLF